MLRRESKKAEGSRGRFRNSQARHSVPDCQGGHSVVAGQGKQAVGEVHRDLAQYGAWEDCDFPIGELATRYRPDTVDAPAPGLYSKAVALCCLRIHSPGK